MVVAIVLAEWRDPVVRTPDGALYRPLKGNRFAAAALQGAIVGATVGTVVIIWYFREISPEVVALDTVVDSAVLTALAFAIAEGVVALVERRAKASS